MAGGVRPWLWGVGPWLQGEIATRSGLVLLPQKLLHPELEHLLCAAWARCVGHEPMC